MTAAIEDLLREQAPRVLGALARRHGQFDACEDAVQEALLAAALQWPKEGMPDDPRAWLRTVAGRRLTDEWRSESARRSREEDVAVRDLRDVQVAVDEDARRLRGAGHDVERGRAAPTSGKRP